MAAKYAEYRDTKVVDVAWWLAQWSVERRRLPSARQLQHRFGMSRATAYRWLAMVRHKQEQIEAREGCYVELQFQD